MIDLPGFADPVAGSQGCFRGLLDAMASPGRVVPAGEGLVAPAPLDPATAAVLLTLLDGDTGVWLAPEIAAARDWLVFHTGAVEVAGGAAAFGVCIGLPSFCQFASGVDEVPEDGATLVVQLPALSGGPVLKLAGPGLRAPASFAPAGLPADFVARWAGNRLLFPRGVDLVLCAGRELAALPRSVRIVAEAA